MTSQLDSFSLGYVEIDHPNALSSGCTLVVVAAAEVGIDGGGDGRWDSHLYVLTQKDFL